VVGHFRADKRILAWDIFNEPDNGNDSSYGKVEFKNKPEMAMALIQKAFAWAREAKPEQPLTAAVWKGDWSNREKITPLDLFMLDSSDIISFHNYDKPESMKKVIADLKKWNRPMICSEYMARPQGSTFQAILPILKENKVGGMNWGCVSGKTQTIYPWDSWSKTYTSEPPVWFHDIFRPDGTPYRPEERSLSRRSRGRARSKESLDPTHACGVSSCHRGGVGRARWRFILLAKLNLQYPKTTLCSSSPRKRGPRGSANDEKGKTSAEMGIKEHNAPVLGSRFRGNDGKRAEPAEKTIR
jgi:hypothetical protein